MKIILFLLLSLSLSVAALPGFPEVLSWSKGDMFIGATVRGDRDDIIDGLVKAINENGGTIADSSQLGSTLIVKTDWFEMPHNVWAYDCKLSFNLSKSGRPGIYDLSVKGSLRARIDGSYVTDNEIRPFIRDLIRAMATGGAVDLK